QARIVRVSPSGRRIQVPWAVEASLGARRGLQRAGQPFGATLYHTQSLCLMPPAAGGRSVISVDATPLQFDRVGEWYGHRTSTRAVEAAKQRVYRRRFAAASASSRGPRGREIHWSWTIACPPNVSWWRIPAPARRSSRSHASTTPTARPSSSSA